MTTKSQVTELFSKLKTTGSPLRYFFAVRKISRKHNDHWQPYQIELIGVQNGRVVLEELIDKPDTKEMVMSKMSLFIDPENSLEAAYVTNTIKAQSV